MENHGLYLSWGSLFGMKELGRHPELVRQVLSHMNEPTKMGE